MVSTFRMVDTLIADILRLSKYEMLYNMLIKHSETSQEKQSCRLFQTSIHQIQTDGGSGEIGKPSLPCYIDHIKCNRAAMACIFILISNSIWCNCSFGRLNYIIIIRYMWDNS